MDDSGIQLGMAATALALVLGFMVGPCAVYGARAGRPAFVEVARQGLYANFALITLACLTIVGAFVSSDFSVLYVAENSNSRLPLLYRLTALWGGHEGSLMLWLWYLTLFAALCAFLHRRSHPHSMPYVMATLALIQVGFLILILFLSSPFTLILPPPPDGRDLNPLLQDPGLVFHPPTLYMGYVGFSVPFAFAI
ncbi:MAG: cytochrome c biogenesis protein CcsA, partial [bacterium]|nr:cytochrome c biogenesis protein CcsA [bacterium]